MNQLTVLIMIIAISVKVYGQHNHDYGKSVSLDIDILATQLKKSKELGNISVVLPIPSGKRIQFELKNKPLYKSQPKDLYTMSGVSSDGTIPVKLNFTSAGLSGIMHFGNSYWFIEPISESKGKYQLYNINELPQGACGSDHLVKTINKIKNSAHKSAGPFPTGSVMRHFRMAAAATGEMSSRLGSQSNARDEIVSIINAANLIYELELSITFDLISETTSSMDIIYTNGAIDPFTVNENFASALNAQNGFIAMNNNGTLTYDKYDIGHVFHVTEGQCCSASGQAGPTVCANNYKSNAWTQYSNGSPIGFITTLFVHEIGHQFRAWHTFNASGGNPGSTSFCDYGWDNETAVEPGSGSTIMAYGTNCSTPTNYILDAPNFESYFHTKSLEQINSTLLSASTCYTTTSTGNTPPVAIAGDDFILPKGTPFELIGTASDADNNTLSYVWEQYDVATASDKGSLGSSIVGSGGYSGVNSSAQAPLFRSVMSNLPHRIFPRLPYILDGSNNPHDNLGEDLPQVGRNMTFRFTVRDNSSSGGGVDSDEMEVAVDGTKGPFLISNFNEATVLSGGMTVDVEWSVNGTDQLSPNINITMSLDGGNSFPLVLSESTPNDGAESVTIPIDVAVSSNARIRIGSLHHNTASFFDINNTSLSTQPRGLTCETFMSANIPIDILDNETVVSKLSITEEGTISDLNVVNLKGTHSWIGDAMFSLVGPDNTKVDIINRRCDSLDDFDLNLDDDASDGIPCPYNNGGTYQPDNALSIFNGKEQMGSWSLQVNDNFGSDEGIIESWGLKICREEETFALLNQSISSVGCDKDSVTFQYNFSVENGSGSYSVIDENNQVIAEGDESPILVNLGTSCVVGGRSFRIMDSANSQFVGQEVVATLPSCPCSSSTEDVSINQDQIEQDAYIFGKSLTLESVTINQPGIKLISTSGIEIQAGFEIITPNGFDAKISTCPE